MEETIQSFVGAEEAGAGVEWRVERGDQFRARYPSLDMGPEGYGCYDPTGGVLLADKETLNTNHSKQQTFNVMTLLNCPPRLYEQSKIWRCDMEPR